MPLELGKRCWHRQRSPVLSWGLLCTRDRADSCSRDARSMTSRIARGFHRIGIVLALPVLLLAAVIAGHEEWLQWSTRNPWAAFPIVGQAPVTPLGKVQVGQDQWWANAPIVKPATASPGLFDDLIPKPHTANFTVPLLLLGLAVALYAVARALGWVVDGFIAPSRSGASE